jgi:hypothetical protein
MPQKKIYGEIIFEFNWFEMSQNYQFFNPQSFYFHHQMHGYTNKGQWMGNATSPGGNSQYLRFELFYPKGNTDLFIGRNNPDNAVVYKDAIKNTSPPLPSFPANFNVGIETFYFVTPSLRVSAGFIGNFLINSYIGDRNNFSLNMGLMLTF